MLDAEYLTADDLAPETRMIAEEIGLVPAVQLIEHLGGAQYHIQSPRRLRLLQAKRMAAAGKGAGEIAVATGLSRGQVQRLMSQGTTQGSA